MASFRRVLAKRIFNAFITILLIMLVNFMLFRVMPADPVDMMTPRDPSTPPEVRDRNIEVWGLNEPLMC